MSKSNSKQLTTQEFSDLLEVLKSRFEQNMNRHSSLDWSKIQAKLESAQQSNLEKLWSLQQMENTGGEPDVVNFDASTGDDSGEFIFYDCSPESPSGRRSLCLDQAAWDSRKQDKPKNSAEGMANEMGIEILTEQQYRDLHKLGNFDSKTSSWLKTPKSVRDLGGAIYADFRFGTVFVYHNGAESYYAARGFRGLLRV